MWLPFLCLLILTTSAAHLGAQGTPPPVGFAQDDRTATLHNEHLTAKLEKRTGRLVSLKLDELELLAPGGGYWSAVGSGEVPPEDKDASGAFALVADPEQTGGEQGEIAWRGTLAHLPLGCELHYVLRRGEMALHAFAVFTHTATQPAVSIGESRMVLKLAPAVFDFLAVDEKRLRLMPTGADWEKGTPLNLKEARRLTTGIHAGEVEHKYDYSALIAQTPAWGWASTQKQVGLWMINPSAEYLGGGPTKVDLTCHLDASNGAPPVLLNMWLSGHYGGRALQLAAGEPWSKVIGPFSLYANRGGEPAALWREAVAHAQAERTAWPPAWMAHPAWTPAAERVTVRGQLLIQDPQAPQASAAGAWVGLTGPPSSATDRFGMNGWQTDAGHYQHWVQADAEGRFTIPQVHPGTYLLNAFASGVLGEFHQAAVEVQSGAALDLGTLRWQPERHGQQLWEIGVPDRSAAEFRHGDDYAHWGLYLQYAEEFPHDVDYVVGRSNYRRDWNYAQPPHIAADGRASDSTWKIRFDLSTVPHGRVTLRLSFCGTRDRGRLGIVVNGQPAGDIGPLPENGVMHRDGIRGAWFEQQISFAPALLVPGENVMELRNRATSWPQGILYDYLRLEAENTAP